MEFRVLGPVEAWSDGVRVDIGSRKQRLVLAVLLLEANRLVPLDRLIDLNWTQDPPASARSTVQVLVSRLRAAFRRAGGEHPEILSQGSGYLLRVAPLSVDVHRFRDLTTKARKADDEQTVELLAQALTLWRGDALADVVSEDVRERLCGDLRDARWTAIEDRVDAQLRLGQSRQVLSELTKLVTEHPVRQRLVGQLMLALYREGHTHDALDTYRRLRQRLSDEFGLDPAPELRRLEVSILRADPSLDVRQEEQAPPESVRPAELPHDPPGFIDRDEQLARLDAGRRSSPNTRIWVISGTAGVGKTALAVHWAHRSRGDFPDGQLYIDLRGYNLDQEPLPPSAALTQLLRGLGADPRLIPPELDGQSKLFRSLMADKQVLLILDNARHADQVMPLIPSAGMVLITSRQRLGDVIVRTNARALPLNVMSAADSVRLLESILGSAQVRDQPMASAELARLCGHLPLALRIAAANIAADPEPDIARLARQMAQGDPLAELTVDGAEDSVVTMAFAVSYRTLLMEHRKLFRLLGLVPGQSFTAQAAGALVDLPVARANQQLKALAAAHLVEQYASGRYRFHDLLRRYASDRVMTEESAADRERARERLFDHYLKAADAAGRQLIPHFTRLPRELADRTHLPNNDSALAWLDAEWPNLTAAVQQTARQGPHRFSWHIADALRAYFHYRGHRTEWLTTASTALEAARVDDDQRAQAAMHQSIALACINIGRYEEAREHLVTALRGNFADGWREGEAGMLNNLSAVHQRLGNPQEAIDCGLRSLKFTKELGLDGGTAMSLANLGFANWQLGKLDQAHEYFSRALKLGERNSARYNVAVLLVDLGNVQRDLGNGRVADEYYARALQANRELGYRYGEATALSGRALLRCETGRFEQARSDAEVAVELTKQIGDTGTEAWALNALGGVCLRLDLPAEAEQHHRRALDIARETRFCWCEANARAGLAESLLHLGDLDVAQRHGALARKLARRAGYRLIEIHALITLAEARVRLGDRQVAAALSSEALRLARDTGYRVGQARATRLLKETVGTSA
ncbi:MAG TPA: BTAD domain-containing putative transcriptional regulator [Micromonosporaceae bacterium]|nr:BTAD domain-containing putative transcriptional regulator [Micromonosporaceae bacterium]